MPRYDYRCESCNDEFELKQTFAEAGTGTCPSCSGAGRRVFHAVPVIYKGSGFYTTDYGRPKQPSDNASGDGSTSADSKSSDSKTSDSKTSDSKTSGDSKSDTAAKSTSDSPSKSSTGSGSAVSTSADSS